MNNENRPIAQPTQYNSNNTFSPAQYGVYYNNNQYYTVALENLFRPQQ